MARSNSIRKKVLREAIEHNVDAMWAAREWRKRHRRQRMRFWLGRISFLVLFPLVALGTIHFVTARVVSPPLTDEALAAPIHPPVSPTALAVARSLRRAAARRAETPVAEPAANLTATFDAPMPIDAAILPLGIRRVVIDPGHGGTSPGTSSTKDLVEKNVTLDIGLRLRTLLEESGLEVRMSREADTSVSLGERASLANSVQGDIFVSIHLNSFPEQTRRGVETYFLGPTDDPALKRLAAIENKDSGYSMSDYRRLLERIYLGVRRDESRRLAESVQKSLWGELHRNNPSIENRGVKTAPFIVLVATEMPAILAEVSCLSNDQETKSLKDPAYRQRIADALARGIRNFADEHGGDEPTGGVRR